MADLEVRELRYFQAVAEELNFSRAAERLGMAQPPLSRAIRQLERRLGVQLFERTSRRVTLTAAGVTLLEEAGRALDAVSAAARRTRRAASPTPAVVVTAKPGVATAMLRRFVEAYGQLPDVPQVHVVVGGYGDQADMVRDGRADMALVGSPFDLRGLDAEPLVSEPRVAALPCGHELTHRRAIRCRDLAGLPVPQWAEQTAAARTYWSGRDREGSPADEPADTRPAAVQGPVVRDSSQLLEVVALGQAVALVPRSFAENNPRNDVVYRPVPDASPYSIAIAWPEDTRSPDIARFVRVAVECAASGHSDEFAEIA